MTAKDRRLWIDVTAARYLEAVEREDYDTQEALWQLAAADAELEAAFHEVHAALLEEEAAATTAAVVAAVETHLPSATVVREPTGPVTFADVADELFRHTPDRLPPEAHALNAKLREATDELPTDLGLSSLIAFAEAKFGAASRDYWKAFREAAMRVRMRATVKTAEYQLAARRGPKPEEQR